MRQGRLPNVLLKPLHTFAQPQWTQSKPGTGSQEPSELCSMITVGTPAVHFQLTFHAETDAFSDVKDLLDMLLPDV